MDTQTLGTLTFAGDTLTLSATSDEATGQVSLQVVKSSDGALVAGENLSQVEMADQDPATYVAGKLSDLNAKLAGAYPVAAPPVSFVVAIMVFLRKLSLVVDAAGAPFVVSA